MSNHSNKPTIVDLFSGCGGLSLGFTHAGFLPILAVDNWDDALLTYKHNHPESKTFSIDLSEAEPISIAEHIATISNNVDMIVGGPPCQGFSISGKRMIEDPRNRLYKQFVKIVNYVRPRLFMMENVPNLVSIGQGIFKKEILEDFSAIGYTVTQQILLASDFGVPQNRKRVFFVGSLDKEFKFPKPHDQPKITSSQAISDLPAHGLADGSSYTTIAESTYQELMRQNSIGIHNHQITNHRQKTKDIISLVPDGGNYKDLPPELQNTRKVNIAWTRLNSQKPSFTIDTGHRHHFHYKYNRVPTAREAARIQSFPDDFIFSGSKTSQNRQVGNAVPPMLAKVLAETIRDQYEI